MLAVLSADGARFDAGSVALAVARRWSDAGEAVLFVDADATGPGLAERLGEVEHAEYSPAQRGLPSLMVSREPLTLPLADHCYSLDTSAGSLWVLFGPHHPAGAELAAQWLAGRSAELAEVDARRSVVVSSSLRAGAGLLSPVLRASTVVVVVAPVETIDAAKELSRLMRDLKLSSQRCRHRALIVEGDSAADDDDIRIEAGMHLAGRLPVVEDEVVLRRHGGRRDRTFTSAVDQIAARLLTFSRLIESDSRTADMAETPLGAAPDPGFEQQLQFGASVNGSRGGPTPPSQPRRKAQRERRV